MTLSSQKGGIFGEFFEISACNTHLKMNLTETVKTRPRQPA